MDRDIEKTDKERNRQTKTEKRGRETESEGQTDRHREERQRQTKRESADTLTVGTAFCVFLATQRKPDKQPGRLTVPHNDRPVNPHSTRHTVPPCPSFPQAKCSRSYALV